MAHRYSNTTAQREAILARGRAIHAAEYIYRGVEEAKRILTPIVREVLQEVKFKSEENKHEI